MNRVVPDLRPTFLDLFDGGSGALTMGLLGYPVPPRHHNGNDLALILTATDSATLAAITCTTFILSYSTFIIMNFAFSSFENLGNFFHDSDGTYDLVTSSSEDMAMLANNFENFP